jgi:hypothetical protein
VCVSSISGEGVQVAMVFSGFKSCSLKFLGDHKLTVKSSLWLNLYVLHTREARKWRRGTRYQREKFPILHNCSLTVSQKKIS